MREILLPIILALGFSAAHAQAVPVIIEYKTAISSIETPIGSLASSEASGFTIAVGQVLTAYLTYDTDFLMHRENYWSDDLYYASVQAPQLSVEFQNSSMPLNSVSGFVTTVEYMRGDFSARVAVHMMDGADIVIQHYQSNPIASLPDGTMPNAEQWESLQTGYTSFVYYPTGQSNWDNAIVASVQSVRSISPVPEPDTYAMFAAGALVLLAARRRKIRRNKARSHSERTRLR